MPLTSNSSNNSSGNDNSSQQRRTRCFCGGFSSSLVILISFTLFYGLWQALNATQSFQEQRIGSDWVPVKAGKAQEPRGYENGNIHHDDVDDVDDDSECPFRQSSLYRKVYVYPDYGSTDWHGSILSQAGRENRSLPWPWLEIDRQARMTKSGHYDIDALYFGQYATELIIRELLTNPRSCLRSQSPEGASLFFVPYMSSTEHHGGNRFVNQVDSSKSPFGNAIRQILDDENYTEWEEVWGLTSQYWKQKRGIDHVLVFSEPLHGLWHEGNRRGNYQYIHTQKQLARPIVVSIEQSATFVQQYPRCAAKNILLPYPNPDGRWYNGYYDRQVRQHMVESNISVLASSAALSAERFLVSSFGEFSSEARPASYFYFAAPHGSCTWLRKALMWNYMQCSRAAIFFAKWMKALDFRHNMHISTFCPCPAGDSPSAKRMFDSILANCIPIVLSRDFVWPFTQEWDANPASSSSLLNPIDFSLRFHSHDYGEKLSMGRCSQQSSTNEPSRRSLSLDVTLEQINATEIARLRRGLQAARDVYFWYRFDDSLPDNPLFDRVLPDGGLAHSFIMALEGRAGGAKWQDCKTEINQTRHRGEVNQFLC